MALLKKIYYSNYDAGAMLLEDDIEGGRFSSPISPQRGNTKFVLEDGVLGDGPIYLIDYP